MGLRRLIVIIKLDGVIIGKKMTDPNVPTCLFLCNDLFFCFLLDYFGLLLSSKANENFRFVQSELIQLNFIICQIK